MLAEPAHEAGERQPRDCGSSAESSRLLRSRRGNVVHVRYCPSARMALGESTSALWLSARGAAALGRFPALKARLELSRAKHPSLAGHCAPRRAASRRSSRATPTTRTHFFRTDGAPAEVAGAAPRRVCAAFRPLYDERFAQDRSQLTAEAQERHLRPAVHRRLPRAVPVQPPTCASTCRSAPSSSPPRA